MASATYTITGTVSRPWFTGPDVPSQLQSKPGVWSNHQTAAPNPSVTIPTPGLHGRYVRVQLSSGNALSLAEVQVMSGGTNVAQGKPATESSTVLSAPAAAVDGNTNGNWGAGSVTHTDGEGNPWWQVDLGTVGQTIDSIVIWNRTDCCAERLTDFWVFVSDVPFTTYTSPVPVSLSTSTPGATIRYTTDGSTPTNTYGTVYGGPINVNTTMTLKAIAYKQDWANSAVAQASYTIQGPLPPSNISVTPSSGSGATQSFTFTVRDGNGYADLDAVQMLVNWAVMGTQACYMNYQRSTNALRLMNDAENAWSAPQTLGSGSPLENSQCLVDVASSSASGAGTDLSVTVRITFKPGYFGPQNLHMLAIDSVGLNSNWQHMGTWTGYPAPSSAPPMAVSVTPSSGSGLSATFSFVGRSLNGAGYYIPQVLLLINGPVSGNQACYALYHPVRQDLYLMNDNETAWTGPIKTGQSGTLQNSQCRIDNPTASIAGNDLTINLPTTFQSSYSGSKGLWMYVYDHGGQNSGWQQLGTWTVAVPVPADVTGLPGRGVKSSGAYWGAAGEQIDLLTGNLNFSVPVARAQARTGWGVTFALSYNSQMWWQYPGGQQLRGRDIGYGLGWTLQAGSIRPESSYYVFTDSTGASTSWT